MTGKKSVLIVDDHPLFREGLRGLIERSALYTVIGESGNGKDGIALAQQARPDLITMDISLPDMTGIDALREIKRLVPTTRILVLSTHALYDYVSEAFKAGASGYVVKEATSQKLIEAMNAIIRGEFFLDGQVSQEIVTRLISEPAKETLISDERYALLSAREQQVMRLIAEGIPSRVIADRLSVSRKTVENHRTNLMKKLDVHSKMELIRYAARLGLIDVDSWKE